MFEYGEPTEGDVLDEFDDVDWDDPALRALLIPPTMEQLQGLELAEHLLATPTGGLRQPDVFEIVDRMAGWDRVVSWAMANRAKAVVEFLDHRPPAVETDSGSGRRGARPSVAVALVACSEFATDEVAARLCLTNMGANQLLSQSCELVNKLPTTLAAAEAGRISFGVAAGVAAETTGLSPEHRAIVEAKVLRKAPGRSASAVRESTRRAAMSVDPVGTRERRDAAVAHHRGVVFKGFADGTVGLVATLETQEGALAFATLDAFAQAADPTNQQGLAQRRADVLVDVLAALREGQPPCSASPRDTTASPDQAAPSAPSQGPRVSTQIRVDVVVSASTLLGSDDEPGLLNGEPIPADLARVLAHDDTATWRRLLTDPARGDLAELSSNSYRPPKRLREFVQARDRHCRFPSCRRRVVQTDLDHTIPWPRGSTSHDNLGGLCRHHHRLRHEGGWQLEQPNPGTFVWTTPAGHTYVVQPPWLPHDITGELIELSRREAPPLADGDWVGPLPF